MTRRRCRGCEKYGTPCPRCDAEAERRAEASYERVTDRRDTRAERMYEARIYGEYR